LVFGALAAVPLLSNANETGGSGEYLFVANHRSLCGPAVAKDAADVIVGGALYARFSSERIRTTGKSFSFLTRRHRRVVQFCM
jgi:hypothetical protein